MRIPKKLKIIPILEAIFEIRFETSKPDDTNIGLIYNEFGSEYNDMQSLPVFNLPLQIRNEDISLRYQPHKKMMSNDGNYLLQFGQRQISLHRVNYTYDVFENYSEKIIDLVKRFKELSVADSISRVGLRYTDFLNDSISGYSFDDLNIEVNIGGLGRGELFTCSSTFSGKSSSHKTQIYNNVKISHNGEEKTGDLIDIDSYIEKGIDLDGIEERLPKIHDEQKDIFFNLLGEKITNLLGPDYGE